MEYTGYDEILYLVLLSSINKGMTYFLSSFHPTLIWDAKKLFQSHPKQDEILKDPILIGKIAILSFMFIKDPVPIGKIVIPSFMFIIY